MSEQTNYLHSDAALTDPADDRFGFAPFAEHLAESITRMAPTEGIVLAIYGEWGSGKSTLINFIQKFIRDQSTKNQLYVLPFNPWWFSGQESLTRTFFTELLKVIGSAWGKKIQKQARHLAKAVSQTNLPYVNWMKGFFGFFLEEKTITQERNELESNLKKQNKKILVIIDDIDRLVPSEIRQVFHLVKSAGNLPNVIYLLAFDKEKIIQALSLDSDESLGKDFLEKIIQVPFELPIPDQPMLRGLFFELINHVFVDIPEENFDQNYWHNVFFEGIDHFLRVPRDAVRLANTIQVTHPAVKGEVNATDFIAIETLRVFCPSIYDYVRKNPDKFTGVRDDRHQRNEQEIVASYDVILEKIPQEDRETTKQLLQRIFPRLESIWGNMSYSAERVGEWTTDLRICSPEIFPVYFKLSVPDGAISNSDLQSMLALSSNVDAFSEQLLVLSKQIRPDGKTRVSAMLERLAHSNEKIADAHIPHVINALFQVGDQLNVKEDDRVGGLLDVADNAVRIGWLLFPLLNRIEKSKKKEVLFDAMLKCPGVYIVLNKVIVLGQIHGRYTKNGPNPEKELFLEEGDLDEMEQIVVQKIRGAAENGSLIDTPNLPRILFAWQDWGEKEETENWTEETIRTDKGLSKFISKFLTKWHSQSVVDAVGKTHYSVKPDTLSKFLDVEEITKRAREIVKKPELPDNEKEAIHLFLDEIDNPGKDKW